MKEKTMKKKRILSSVLALCMAALCAFPAAAEELPQQEGMTTEEGSETVPDAEAVLSAEGDEMAEDFAGEAVLEDEAAEDFAGEAVLEDEMAEDFAAETILAQEAAADRVQEGWIVSDTGGADQIVTFEDVPFDAEEAFSLYAESILYDEDPGELMAGGETVSLPADYGTVTGAYLSGNEKALYDYLKPLLAKIADGSVTSTVIQVPVTVFGLQAGVTYSAEDLGADSVDPESISAYLNTKISCDMGAVVRALLFDCPYELYWFDKVNGLSCGTGLSYGYNSSAVIFYTENFEYSFYVNDSYETEEDFVVSSAKLSAVKTAVSSAAAIVSKYAAGSDYQKILGYFNEIKSLVTYNDDAAASSGFYGDPWQLIYVFDNDSSTNVVCEGYSKAFQYLCDQTVFASSDVEAICVNGTMVCEGSGGAHMWNIIRMDDGNRYLVDVTNCDDGSIGQTDQLFLKAPASGSVSAGYNMQASGCTVTYTYGTGTLNSYPEAWLTLRSSDYTEPEEETEHNYVAVSVKEPTCTEKGYTTYECSRCKDTYTANEVPALGHSYTSTVTAPTCTAGGYTTYTCSRCKNSYTGDKTSALGHNYTSVVTAATCTSGGYTTYTCSRCKNSYTGDKTSALGHSYTSIVTAPTCTSGGYTTYTCSRCKDSYQGNKTSALGHNYVIVSETDPTCTEKGYTTYECSRCKDTYTDEVDALGHKYTSAVTDPTCTEGGYTTYTCSRCKDSYQGNKTSALGHNYTSVVTAATCTTGGYTTYTCSRCKDTYTANEVPALGHSYTSTVTAATCTAGGYTTYTCSRCKDSYQGNKTSALGHNYTRVVTAATCTEGGYTTYTCSRCKDSYQGNKTSALGHNYVIVSETDPTCTSGGYTTYTCSRCKDTYTADEVPALGHNYTSVVTAATCTSGGYTTYTCSRCKDSYTGNKTSALGHTKAAAVKENATAASSADGESYQMAVYCSTCGTELSRVTTYVVRYYANGGSGAPSAQTKKKGKTVTISSAQPARTGYVFNGWNTAKDGSGTAYAAGTSYSKDAGLALYAQWKKIPEDVTVTSLTNGWYGMTLRWSKAASAKAYTVYRRTVNADGTTSAWKTIQTGLTAASYYDKTTVSGQTYEYMVKGVRDGVESLAGTAKSGLYLSAPVISAVEGDGSNGNVKITWSAVNGAKGYYVYRKDTQAGTWTFMGSATGTTFTDKGAKKALVNGTVYYYAIKAYAGDVKSASGPAKNIIFLEPISIQSVSSKAGGTLTITFSSNAKATGYEVYYGGQVVRSAGASKTSITLSGLTSGNAYQIKVRAYRTVAGYTFYSSEWTSLKGQYATVK